MGESEPGSSAAENTLGYRTQSIFLNPKDYGRARAIANLRDFLPIPNPGIQRAYPT